MTGYQQELLEPLVQMSALRMSVDPTTDIRPRLMVHALITAAMVAWLAWIADPDTDGFLIFDQALDMLEDGMTKALAPVSGGRLLAQFISLTPLARHASVIGIACHTTTVPPSD